VLGSHGSKSGRAPKRGRTVLLPQLGNVSLRHMSLQSLSERLPKSWSWKEDELSNMFLTSVAWSVLYA
jgi:hypothetical protein